ncbi:MAG: hypothetical protein ACK5O2_11305 [Microthrixaceae bacterium]
MKRTSGLVGLGVGVGLVATVLLAAPVAAQEIVLPGQFCSTEGATAQTSNGVAMQCSSDGDDQPRWREATGSPAPEAPALTAPASTAPVPEGSAVPPAATSQQAQPQGELAKTGNETVPLALAGAVMFLVGVKFTILSDDLAFRSRMRRTRAQPVRYQGPGW